MSKLQSVNPSTYEILGEIDVSQEEDIIQKVNLAKQAQKE